MKLFLCSHFSSVGSLIKEEIENKKVAFIPTASLREGYTGYVGSARKLFKKLGAIVTEIDISTEAYSTIQSVFEEADVIYFTGGNSFFLMDQLRKTGTDGLLKKELANGKLMIGESAGAIICAPSIQYIEQMDEKPEDYSQEDDAGLDLIDFYVLPHYLTAPFKKVTEKIMTEFSDLNLCPINNRQGIVIDGEGCNGVQREHNKKLNNGLPILHKVPPKRDYGRYFCIMAEKGGTSHGGLTEKLSPFFHAKKQEVNAYGR